MVKIGIVGARIYKNKYVVESIINQCVKKYGNDICIISGGAKGADLLGKIVALEKNLKYIEYNPAHTAYNQYSGKPKEWYDKKYNVGHFFERNSFIAEDSQLLFAFIPDGHTSNGTQDTVSKIKKLGKPYFIIN